MSKKNLWIINLVSMIVFAVAVVVGIVIMAVESEIGGAGLAVFLFALPMFVTALFLFLYCRRDTFKRLYLNYICSPLMIGLFVTMIVAIVMYGKGGSVGYLLGAILSAIFFSVSAIVFLFNIISTIVKNHKASKNPSEVQPA